MKEKMQITVSRTSSLCKIGILYTNMSITDDDILIHNFHGQGLHGGVGNLPDGQFFAHPRENLFLLDTDKLRVWIL
jgi:hypothetical protein